MNNSPIDPAKLPNLPLGGTPIESDKDLVELKQKIPSIPEKMKAYFLQTTTFGHVNRKAKDLELVSKSCFAGAGFVLGISVAAVLTSAVALTPVGWMIAGGAAVTLAVIGLSVLLYRHHELKSEGLKTDLGFQLTTALGVFCGAMAFPILMSTAFAASALLSGMVSVFASLAAPVVAGVTGFMLTSSIPGFEREFSFPLIEDESSPQALLMFHGEYGVIDTDEEGQAHFLIRNQTSQSYIEELKKQAENPEDQNYSNALFQLANLYLEGDEEYQVIENQKRAFHLYCLAAEKGHPEAALAVAKFYNTGEGVKQNLQEAARYFAIAAERNVIEAQITMGKICERGFKDNPANSQEAIKWYSKAAEAHPNASKSGTLYAKAAKLAAELNNEEQVIQLYEYAAKKGNKEAKEKLIKMYKAREQFEKALHWQERL